MPAAFGVERCVQQDFFTKGTEKVQNMGLGELLSLTNPRFIGTSQILHIQISTQLLIMEVDFCPVLCIAKMPILQAFWAISHFVWYRSLSSNELQMV